MRVAGIVIAVAGLLGAIAGPVLGFPGAFAVLLVVAVVLWLVGIGAAAASIAPWRPLVFAACATAAVCGWPLLLVYTYAPIWGAMAVACGVVSSSNALQARITRR